MAKKDFIVKEGVVTESLPGSKFIIKLKEEEKEVTGYLSGKMRRFKIWILPGDLVKVEFSEYDENTCRIVYRFK
ncbi:translation initiation factor IF-1 [candidate division WWE3 bacterium CG_4_9_14_3_um_filter_34_6]|uniref:Translation initiation factor IF-1 n=1 Tax=candidate division WWE3 bacterium CG_4_9_14_3_um_filter_34_6 TaxID=1975079 RepID=A0A2M7X4C2_UNCKA|nr:MAG: translation initiation factor IF-1 [candidate division WWE3 bacterium CG_4_9_14_3_um_filter_34_6]